MSDPATNPKNWVAAEGEDGNPYYYNEETGDTSWDRPLTPSMRTCIATCLLGPPPELCRPPPS